MRAVVYEEFGGADVLRVVDRPEPHIGADAAVVKVAAASLNPVDYKIREGYLRGLMDVLFPAVPGWDVSGTVVKAGLDTPELQVGDEVLAYVRKDVVQDGTLAEYVAVPVRTAAKKPAGLSFEEAAALPLAGLTALQSIRRAGLTEGSTVLVHAAAGGVGSIAVQLAVHAGARVVGTASAGNHDYLRSLGAEPVAYGDGLVEAARGLVPDGFDVILDYVGGQAIETAPALLRPGGTIASITDARARDELGGQYVWVRPDSADLAELAELAARGVVKVEIAGTYPLEEAAEAYRALETGHTRGKIVVTV
ncbi:NADP-dependent oxidoreductase [Cellulomonas sp. IC4_254]|uniref:NADP-dependent oxidoreductase n=1 Tax=Cellulomonas sp. IC4_254 TaxID=2714040 RepID=UPI0014202550|nr:NADP-dependent oxidoreductase [Cellulomonas sp. IC4_254]NHT16334.1 NADP-dependent oxidoreductase [Cellulomonas sp. IC4_254]